MSELEASYEVKVAEKLAEKVERTQGELDEKYKVVLGADYTNIHQVVPFKGVNLLFNGYLSRVTDCPRTGAIPGRRCAFSQPSIVSRSHRCGHRLA